MREVKADHPILFSTPMITAILAGRKTVTRRIIQESFNGCLTNGGPHPCPNEPVVIYPGETYESRCHPGESITVNYPQVRALFHCSTLDAEAKCRFGKPGDILWVRETWAPFMNAVQGSYGFIPPDEPYYPPFYIDKNYYNAFRPIDFFEQYPKSSQKWRPSIHMPKTAARIFLRVKNITVEALHDITEEDAIKEGIEELLQSGVQKSVNGRLFRDYLKEPEMFNDGLRPIESFKSLWIKINGEDSWRCNPWVWRVEFSAYCVKGTGITFFEELEDAGLAIEKDKEVKNGVR